MPCARETKPATFWPNKLPQANFWGNIDFKIEYHTQKIIKHLSRFRVVCSFSLFIFFCTLIADNKCMVCDPDPYWLVMSRRTPSWKKKKNMIILGGNHVQNINGWTIFVAHGWLTSILESFTISIWFRYKLTAKVFVFWGFFRVKANYET